MYTEKMSERLAIVATIDPAVIGDTTDTDVIDMKLYRRVLFVIAVGALAAANATVQVTVYGNTANSTSSPTPVALTGKVLSASTFSGSAGANNKQALIEVTAEEVAAQGLRYVFAEVTETNGGGTMTVIALASDARFGPAADDDLASVAEIVS